MSAVALNFPIMPVKDKTAKVYIRVKKVEKNRHHELISAIAMVPILPAMWSVHKLNEKLIDRLNSPELDSIPNHSVKEVAQDLRELGDKLTKLLSFLEPKPKFLGYRQLLSALEHDRDHFLSIIEGLYLSLDPNFQSLLSDSKDEIEGNQGSLSAENSLVGQM